MVLIKLFKRWINRFSFRQKLFFSYLSVMLVCCVMSGVQVYLAVNNELKSQREQILSSFTTEVASNFDRSMETCRNPILGVIGDRKVSSSTLNYVTDSYYQQYEDLRQTFLHAVSLVKL